LLLFDHGGSGRAPLIGLGLSPLQPAKCPRVVRPASDNEDYSLSTSSANSPLH
jgi:hypothetical protein